jgi:hypothetical protein
VAIDLSTVIPADGRSKNFFCRFTHLFRLPQK